MNRFFESYSDSSDEEANQELEKDVSGNDDENGSDILDQKDRKSEVSETHVEHEKLMTIVSSNSGGQQVAKSKTFRDRFELLCDRTKEMAKRNTNKRIRRLRKDIMDRVKRTCTEQERDVIFNGNPDDVVPSTSSTASSTTDTPEILQPCESESSEWLEVTAHLNEFDHLKGLDKGKYNPKSGLEKKLDLAISLGEVEVAEKLSDRLASRDFTQKLSNAFDARKFVKENEKLAAAKRKRKKPKLTWTMENKSRWETKSNM